MQQKLMQELIFSILMISNFLEINVKKMTHFALELSMTKMQLTTTELLMKCVLHLQIH